MMLTDRLRTSLVSLPTVSRSCLTSSTVVLSEGLGLARFLGTFAQDMQDLHQLARFADWHFAVRSLCG